MKKIVLAASMSFKAQVLEIIEVEVEKGFASSNLETPGSDPEEDM